MACLLGPPARLIVLGARLAISPVYSVWLTMCHSDSQIVRGPRWGETAIIPASTLPASIPVLTLLPVLSPHEKLSLGHCEALQILGN